MAKPVAGASSSSSPAFPFARDEIVECIESFFAWAPGGEDFVKGGARMRANEPVVQRHPERFVRDGATDKEKYEALQRAHPAVEPTQHTPMGLAEEPLLDEDAVIAIRSVRGAADGDVHIRDAVVVSVGQRLPKNHPLVRSQSKSFVLVVPVGRTRSNSVRALTDWAETRRDDDGILIAETDPTARQRFGEFKRFILWRKGQWVDRDNEIVKKHPTEFEAIL